MKLASPVAPFEAPACNGFLCHFPKGAKVMVQVGEGDQFQNSWAWQRLGMIGEVVEDQEGPYCKVKVKFPDKSKVVKIRPHSLLIVNTDEVRKRLEKETESLQWLKPPTTVHKFRENGALSVDTSLAAPLATGTPTRTETGTKTEESTVENEKAKGEASFPAINRAIFGENLRRHMSKMMERIRGRANIWKKQIALERMSRHPQLHKVDELYQHTPVVDLIQLPKCLVCSTEKQEDSGLCWNTKCPACPLYGKYGENEGDPDENEVLEGPKLIGPAERRSVLCDYSFSAEVKTVLGKRKPNLTPSEEAFRTSPYADGTTIRWLNRDPSLMDEEEGAEIKQEHGSRPPTPTQGNVANLSEVKRPKGRPPTPKKMPLSPAASAHEADFMDGQSSFTSNGAYKSAPTAATGGAETMKKRKMATSASKSIAPTPAKSSILPNNSTGYSKSPLPAKKRSVSPKNQTLSKAAKPKKVVASKPPAKSPKVPAKKSAKSMVNPPSSKGRSVSSGISQVSLPSSSYLSVSPSPSTAAASASPRSSSMTAAYGHPGALSYHPLKQNSGPHPVFGGGGGPGAGALHPGAGSSLAHHHRHPLGPPHDHTTATAHHHGPPAGPPPPGYHAPAPILFPAAPPRSTASSTASATAAGASASSSQGRSRALSGTSASPTASSSTMTVSKKGGSGSSSISSNSSLRGGFGSAPVSRGMTLPMPVTTPSMENKYAPRTSPVGATHSHGWPSQQSLRPAPGPPVSSSMSGGMTGGMPGGLSAGMVSAGMSAGPSGPSAAVASMHVPQLMPQHQHGGARHQHAGTDRAVSAGGRLPILPPWSGGRR